MAIIGATGWRSAPDVKPGAAYVFINDGAGWVERVRLVAADGRHGEQFGGAVALEGDVLAVAAVEARRGNPGNPDFAPGAGAVYLFSGHDATWSQQAKLMPNDLVTDNVFGLSLDLDGQTLLVGAPHLGFGHEAVYFYSRQGSDWTGPVTFLGPDQTADHNFGVAVAVAGDAALVGAPGINCCDPTADFEPGVVYVFTRSGGVWSPAGSFMPADGFPGDNFGCDIAFDGTTAVIAACQAYGLPAIHGYAYVFTRNDATWTQTARLEPEGDDLFSLGIHSVALAGDQLVLGSPSAPPQPAVGRLYPYVREGATWLAQTPISSPDDRPDTDFGWTLALSAEHLLAGAAYLPKLNVAEQGGVYSFAAPPSGFTLFAPVIAAPSLESPDGLIAYYGYNDGQFDLFLVRSDGTGKTNLTHSAANEGSPAWSPDGTRLVFTQSVPGEATTLIITDAAGANRRVVPLANDLSNIGAPTWSPDGTRLAFVARGTITTPRYDIFVVKLDGSGLVNVTAGLPGNSYMPDWSPDGAKIVFENETTAGAPKQLAVVGPAGGDVTFLTNDDTWHELPAWSPNGARLLFTVRGDNFSQHLYTMPAGGGPPTLLLASATMGRWSPDGTHVVFIGDDGGLFRAAAGGGDITTLDATEDVFSPDWQP
jgi:Tol biopolymer transport system component